MGKEKKEDKEDEEYRFWHQVPSQDFLLFLLLCYRIRVDSLREREREGLREGEAKLLLIRCPVLSVASRHQEHHPQRHEVGARFK